MRAPIDCETHDVAVLEVGRLQKRIAELEAAIRNGLWLDPHSGKVSSRYYAYVDLAEGHPILIEVLSQETGR